MEEEHGRPMRDDGWGSSNLFSSPPPGSSYANPYSKYLEGRKDHESSESILPKERIILYKEISNLYAFNVIGNTATLKLLLDNLARAE